LQIAGEDMTGLEQYLLISRKVLPTAGGKKMLRFRFVSATQEVRPEQFNRDQTLPTHRHSMRHTAREQFLRVGCIKSKVRMPLTQETPLLASFFLPHSNVLNTEQVKGIHPGMQP
jgi:hypothetical protein